MNNAAGRGVGDGYVPNLGRALQADSGGAILGSVLGTSTTVSYIESAAGGRADGPDGGGGRPAVPY
jgi:AGZA family xanthine/uracil permease-like MFS transporter